VAVSTSVVIPPITPAKKIKTAGSTRRPVSPNTLSPRAIVPPGSPLTSTS
jgi:hypothetical protein